MKLGEQKKPISDTHIPPECLAAIRNIEEVVRKLTQDMKRKLE